MRLSAVVNDHGGRRGRGLAHHGPKSNITARDMVLG